MNDLKLIILEQLAREWASGLALSKRLPDLGDRNATSLMLNALKGDGYVKKAANGYFKITDEGRSYLAKKLGSNGDEIDNDSNSHNTLTQGVDTSVLTKRAEPTYSHEPVVSKANGSLNTSKSISEIQKQMPDNASLVIESGTAFIAFEGARYRIEKDGDIDAVLRTAQLYTGRY